jgi:dsRNA-specific ribonuclease
MVAASNVTQEKELNQITSLIQTLITYYLHEVGKTNHTIQNNTEQQNYYAQNQKQNPHTPRVMAKLGLNEEDVKLFIQEYLFPEIES